MKVAILGASPKAARYSNKALHLLLENGHGVYPIHPQFTEIDGVPAFKSLGQCPKTVDVLTIYVNPEIGESLILEIISLAPKTVILNPGTESEMLISALRAANISVVEACTLVLLRTHQFTSLV